MCSTNARTLYDAGDEIGIVWDDPGIGIDWPVKEPVVSGKDRAAPKLAEIADRLAGTR